MESSPRPEPVDDGSEAGSGVAGRSGAADDAEGYVEDGDGADDAEEDVEDVEDGNGDGDGENGPDPLRFSNWMKRSATGAVMSGIAFGLKEALQPKQPIPFVIEASGEPDDPDKPIDLQFDPDSPADTVAIIRRPPVADDPKSAAPPA